MTTISQSVKVGPLTVSLDDGEHSVQLTGIRADDGIATYYIEFSGDVVSVNGDELSGRDLCPNTQKKLPIISEKWYCELK